MHFNDRDLFAGLHKTDVRRVGACIHKTKSTTTTFKKNLPKNGTFLTGHST